MTRSVITIPPKVPRDMKKFAGKLRGFARNQFKFATSRAINETLFRLREKEISLYQQSFQVRNRRFIKSALRVKKSSKRNLVGHLFDRLGKDWLERQAKGGRKTARGKYLTIPIHAKKRAKGARDPRSFPNTFVGKSRDGTPGIFQRQKRRLRMLFALKPSVRVDKGYPFYRLARRHTAKTFDKNFADSWRYALRTARL